MVFANNRVAVAVICSLSCILDVSSFGYDAGHSISPLISSGTLSTPLPTTTSRIIRLSAANHEEEEGVASFPVHVDHQGYSATIYVREDEPILSALERQSTFPNNNNNSEGTSLALSHIPHECRRGNCLTCSSRILSSTTYNKGDTQSAAHNNILANVNNGLSPTISSELEKSGFILTCCSYITGPGVELELDQNNNAWDMIYRKRISNIDTQQLVLEAQARLLRRVDEENLDKWKTKLEEEVGKK